MGRSAAVLGRVLRNRRLRRVELAFAGFSLAEYGVWTAILCTPTPAAGRPPPG